MLGLTRTLVSRSGNTGRRCFTTLYKTQVTATGTGRKGNVKCEENNFSATLEMPVALGGKGNKDGSTNPEILFASGYSSCYLGAAAAVAKKAINKDLPSNTAVTAVVSLGRDDPHPFKLAVELQMSSPSLTKDEIAKVMEAANVLCPYSVATRNNVTVTLTPM